MFLGSEVRLAIPIAKRIFELMIGVFLLFLENYFKVYYKSSKSASSWNELPKNIKALTISKTIDSWSFLTGANYPTKFIRIEWYNQWGWDHFQFLFNGCRSGLSPKQYFEFFKNYKRLVRFEPWHVWKYWGIMESCGT